MKSPRKVSLFLLLFGIPFLGVGIGTGFFSVRSLVRAQAMLSWNETPATVLACDLHSESDSDGGTTYRVTATYTYEVNGTRYTGDRVSLHSGADNIGSFHHRIYAALSDCRNRKRPTTCWVNPQNPSEAVLIRKPRPEMIFFFQLFTLGFGAAGLAVMMSGASMLLQRARVVAADGLIRMRGASTHRVMTAVALLWNGYAGWLLWTLRRVLSPDPVPWYFWVIAGIGALLAVIAGYQFGRFRKFGVSVFALSPAPGVVGGPVTGNVRIPAKVEAPDGFELSLHCLHKYTTQSGGESSTCTEVRWEDSRHAVAGLDYGEETVVSVRFAVPFDQPETTADEGDGYSWRLTAAAKAPGIDYKAVFDVPVMKTAQSSPGYSAAQMFDPAARREKISEVVKWMSLRLEPRTDGGFELVCPAARAAGMIVFLLPFTAVWSGVCYVLWFVAHAPLLFPIVFSFFEAVLLLVLVNVLLVSRGIIFDRSQRMCVVWTRLLGIKVREKGVPFDEVFEFRCERSGNSGNTVYFRIVLKRQKGRSLTVAGDLKSRKDAESIGLLLTAGVQSDFSLDNFCV